MTATASKKGSASTLLQPSKEMIMMMIMILNSYGQHNIIIPIPKYLFMEPEGGCLFASCQWYVTSASLLAAGGWRLGAFLHCWCTVQQLVPPVKVTYVTGTECSVLVA
eukprot:scaffold68115_cov70-Attheya_sp.AAC.7